VIFPVLGPTTYCGVWGDPRGSSTHKGVDICAPMSTPIVAAYDGTVSRGTDPSGGNVIVEKLADGSAVYYAHLSAYEGAFPRAVRAGETIGYVGMTGSAALVGIPHLHFERWSNGMYTTPYDPMPELRAAQRSQALPQRPAPFPALFGAALILATSAGLAFLLRAHPLPRRRLRVA